jgi:hypothetical protein
MATLTSAAARIADSFLPDGQILANEQKVGIITGLLVITLLSNACGIKVIRLDALVPMELIALSFTDDSSEWSNG